jgi:hypothetical protein
MNWPTYQRTLVLGLGHRARQGKDLVIRLLQEAFPGRVQRVAFADALKAYARIAHGMTVKDGPLLQRLGVQARETDPDVWVRAAAWAIAELDADTKQPQVVCIPDVRFPNEWDFVERAGGRLCRVVRLHEGGERFVASDRPANHVTETALEDAQWPHTLSAASGDLESLRRGAVALVNDYLGTPAHDELYALATPCAGGCGKVRYPAGTCRTCQKKRR